MTLLFDICQLLVATVEVTMKPKDVGFFNEIIQLKCNTEHPAKLRIRGRAE